MKKATPPPHWCSDAGAVNYEGDFDGDQILDDHFCWDGQGSSRRFWTYLSTKPPGSRGGSQQGTTSFCTEPGAVLSVEELDQRQEVRPPVHLRRPQDVVVGAHQRVVGHNGGMVRYAGGVV
eukprot:Sspe_Gene.26040::Locus_10630_Transcript_1_1_Confidence_1.000_Length_590::g.26040::m.26040